MSTVAEISEAIERLDLKDQIELLKALPRHLKLSPDDPACSWLVGGQYLREAKLTAMAADPEVQGELSRIDI